MAGLTLEHWFFLAGGVALVLLGLSVGILRRRLPTALAFAALTVGMGLAGFASAIDSVDTIWGWLMLALVTIGMWSFFVLFPRRLARDEIRPATLVALWALGLSTVLHASRFTMVGDGPLTVLAVTVDAVINLLATAGLVAVALILPVRVARMPGHELAEARSVGIVAAGFAMFTAGTFAHIALAARGEVPLSDAVFDGAAIILPVLLWLRAVRGPHGRVARNVIVASAAIYLGSYAVGPGTAWAAGRLMGGLLLAYAVLRGHLEGLDLKARFAISRSTVAAVFIAVFFIASEAAQQYLGDTTGSTYLGIAAAGALVFAIAPLQRAAERLAEKAVPKPAADASMRLAQADAAYVAALRAAARDGTLSRREEHHLADVAENLGIGPKRALELREHFEQQPDGGATWS